MNMKKFIKNWKRQAKEMKLEIYAIYLAYKDPRVHWRARIFAACVVGYAFSPIDLIPDFIPVLGYLDDLVLIPLGVILVRKMIPPAVLDECREKALKVMRQRKPENKVAAIIIIIIWLGLAVLAFVSIRHFF